MKKIIILLFLFCWKGYSEEVKYTKSGIPIKFYGLLDLDNVNYNTDGLEPDSLIYKIKMLEKHR